MGAPQVIVVILLTISFVVGAFKHGEKTTIDLRYKILDIVGWTALLYWGGFWK